VVERRTYLEHLVHVAKLRAVGLVREVDIVARHLADALPMMHRPCCPYWRRVLRSIRRLVRERTRVTSGGVLCDQGTVSQGQARFTFTQTLAQWAWGSTWERVCRTSQRRAARARCDGTSGWGASGPFCAPTPPVRRLPVVVMQGSTRHACAGVATPVAWTAKRVPRNVDASMLRWAVWDEGVVV
jgi:hypothetical protein